MVIALGFSHSLSAQNQARIIGGAASELSDNPGIVSLQRASNDPSGEVSYYHHCGGIHIGSGFVLTAAHCITPDLWVAFGSESLAEMGELVQVKTYYIHPKYQSPLEMSNDIAILYIGSEIDYSAAKISSIAPSPGTALSVSGWGMSDMISYQYASSLLSADITLLESNVCSSVFPINPMFDEGFDDQTMLCAGSVLSIADSCYGDSGGPLYTHEPGYEPELVGLVSWGPAGGCAIDGIPGVYTKLSSYTNWISQVLTFAEFGILSARLNLGQVATINQAEELSFLVEFDRDVVEASIELQSHASPLGVALPNRVYCESSQPLGATCELSWIVTRYAKTNEAMRLEFSFQGHIIPLDLPSKYWLSLDSTYEGIDVATSSDLPWVLDANQFHLGTDNNNIGASQTSILRLTTNKMINGTLEVEAKANPMDSSLLITVQNTLDETREVEIGTCMDLELKIDSSISEITITIDKSQTSPFLGGYLPDRYRVGFSDLSLNTEGEYTCSWDSALHIKEFTRKEYYGSFDPLFLLCSVLIVTVRKRANSKRMYL